jgi:hypothetical protein
VCAERPVTDISAHDVVTVIDAAVQRGAEYQAHNLLGHVRRLFNWAIGRNIYGLDRSPCDRMRPKDGALIALHQHNPRRMAMLMASRWSPPDWVCSEIDAWLAREREPWPRPLTAEDRKRIAAVNAYHNEPRIAINERGDREKRGDYKDGIADKHGVSPRALENFLGCEGGTYRRIRDWRQLERAFEEWKGMESSSHN